MKTMFCLYYPKFFQKKKKTNLQVSPFFSIVEVREKKEVKLFFILRIKSSCFIKGHWFYTLVLDQMLSLFLKWFFFYGWCNTVDILSAHASLISRLVFLMSNYINLFYDWHSENPKSCVF